MGCLIVYIPFAGRMLFNVSLSLSISFLVGAFLWVGLIVNISFGGTMLLIFFTLTFYFFYSRRLFVGWFDWEGGALECRTIDCRLRIPLGTSSDPPHLPLNPRPHPQGSYRQMFLGSF